jgi:peptide deformylase
MIYPITAYGDPVLRARATVIPANYEGLDQLIADMFATMEHAHGVGLAAPQIGKSVRLFVIDSTPMVDDPDDSNPRFQQPALRRAFINPVMVAETGAEWGFDEGCLSIPGIREQVQRPERIRLRYENEQREVIEEEFDGIAARIIQHEYDHLEGILFTDHLNALKKRLLKNRLTRITKGDVDADYRMRFPAAGPGRR